MHVGFICGVHFAAKAVPEWLRKTSLGFARAHDIKSCSAAGQLLVLLLLLGLLSTKSAQPRISHKHCCNM
jgi:hypothetical protein